MADATEGSSCTLSAHRQAEWIEPDQDQSLAQQTAVRDLSNLQSLA